jgi:hypothetical protein
VNAPKLDRWGDPIEEDDTLDPTSTLARTPDEIRQHCTELRAVLAESRARREAQS